MKALTPGFIIIRIAYLYNMVLTALNALRVLNYLFQVIHFYRGRINILPNNRHRDSVGQLLNLIQILYNMIKWLFKKWRVRRKNLNTPSVLIKLLTQYRATRFNFDCWNNLARNWTDFFWLTGETPDTLNLLVQLVRANLRNVRGRNFRRGRRPALTFRNQVRNFLQKYRFSNIGINKF